MRASRTLVFALSLVTAAPLSAQTLGGTSAPLYATREGLQDLLRQYEEAAGSGAYSSDYRALANQEADLIRSRLEEGDFQVGDKILLQVLGQETLTDTFTVATGRVIHLPNIGEIPLRGKLRSELPAYMQETIGSYVRNADVDVGALVQIAVIGDVRTPGFHWVGAETLVTDLIMTAGGPTPSSNIEKAEIHRGQQTIWKGEPLQMAMRDGRTIDQISLRSGDQIEIPTRTGSIWRSLLSAAPYLLPLGFAISRIF